MSEPPSKRSKRAESHDPGLPNVATIPRPPPDNPLRGSSELRKNLVRASVAGRLDFIRAVFDDPELVKLATYTWEHSEDCRNRERGTPWYRCSCDRVLRQEFSAENIRWYREGPNRPLVTYPLLIHACEHGHLHIARFLVDKGANINTFVSNCLYGNSHENATADRTALLAACKSGSEDVANFLIEQGAVLTPYDTYVTKRRSYGRYYGQDVSVNTPLSWASWNGMVNTVKLMIESGVLKTTSTLRGNETNFLNQYQRDHSRELVGYSVREALSHAWTYSTGLEVDQDEATGHSKVLELLGQSGVSLYSLYEGAKTQTCEESKEKNAADLAIMRRVNVRHFTDDGRPSAQTLALIRGLRHVNEACLNAAGVVLPETRIATLIDLEWKKTYWRSEVEFLEEKHRNHPWMQPWADIVLLAAEPWSRRNHHLFPVAVRRYAFDLFLIGIRISQEIYGNEGSSLVDVWETKVLAFVIH